jgi:hypothetical protein
MKKIETDNGQIFEIIETKTELKSWIKDIVDPFNTGKWDYEDSGLSFYDKSGDCHAFITGDKLGKIKSSDIVSLIENNDMTTVIYGNVEIVYNDHYEDWEAEYKL